jgi:uncharacterized protein YndB with AHSA1/START domain
MSGYRVVRDYTFPIELVWRALTDPILVPRWTTTGRSGRPVGFAAVVGTRFRYEAKPMIGWDGIVECEVLEVHAPTLLRYTWRGGADDDLTLVTNVLDGATRLTWDHTGFTGAGGFVMSRILGAVRRKMLATGLPALLSELDTPHNAS